MQMHVFLITVNEGKAMAVLMFPELDTEEQKGQLTYTRSHNWWGWSWDLSAGRLPPAPEPRSFITGSPLRLRARKLCCVTRVTSQVWLFTLILIKIKQSKTE